MKRFALLVVVLAGCATPQQRAEKTIDQFGPYCEKLGYSRNTDPWRDCILKEQVRLDQIIWSD